MDLQLRKLGYIADPMRIEDGKAIAPERPGHGVAFDWKRLDGVRA